ncbi:hypothetical protein DPMN_051893 [Dreissena polymorpha]|uniref:Uncharacterized protein n=1 Tax=Dreissena polymorpha TaxID=45954 RepID=A0A9D4CKD6_DREPO|nr:hypothetical protein DPMN_051893 [Dreissena polymorpha]
MRAGWLAGGLAGWRAGGISLYIDHDWQMTPIDFEVTRHIDHDWQMTPIGFEVTRTKVKVTVTRSWMQFRTTFADYIMYWCRGVSVTTRWFPDDNSTRLTLRIMKLHSSGGHIVFALSVGWSVGWSVGQVWLLGPGCSDVIGYAPITSSTVRFSSSNCAIKNSLDSMSTLKPFDKYGS